MEGPTRVSDPPSGQERTVVLPVLYILPRNGRLPSMAH